MSKERQTWKVGVGALLLGLLGCDSGEESVRVKECRNVCDKRNMCLSDTDVADCEQRCDHQEFRSDLYYQLKAECVGDGSLSCDQWANELDVRGEDVCLGDGCKLDECVHRKLLDHKLSDEQEKWCEDLSNDLFACDRSLNANEVTAVCKKTLLEVSPEYAAESEDCVNIRCLDVSGFRQCFADLALKYDTQIRIFGL